MLSLGLLTLEEWHFDSYTKKVGNRNKQGVWNVRITYCFRSGNWAVSESCCQDLFVLARFWGQFCSFPLIMRSLTLLKILFLISDGQHQFLFLVTKHHVWHTGWLHIIPGILEKYWYLQVVLEVARRKKRLSLKSKKSSVIFKGSSLIVCGRLDITL